MKSGHLCDAGGRLAAFEQLLSQENALRRQIGEDRGSVLLTEGVAEIVFADEKMLR